MALPREITRTSAKAQGQLEMQPREVGRAVCIQTLLPSVPERAMHLLFSINLSVVKVHCSQALGSPAGGWEWVWHPPGLGQRSQSQI